MKNIIAGIFLFMSSIAAQATELMYVSMAWGEDFYLTDEPCSPEAIQKTPFKHHPQLKVFKSRVYYKRGGFDKNREACYVAFDNKVIVKVFYKPRDKNPCVDDLTKLGSCTFSYHLDGFMMTDAGILKVAEKNLEKIKPYNTK
jgi:signal peptidase I